MKTTNSFKIFILTLLLIICSLNSFGQVEKEISIFNRLLILNSKNELLIVKVENTDLWVTPGIYKTSNQPIKQALDSLSDTYGITIKKLKLNGVFILKRNLNGENSTSLRNIYTAKVQKYELKKPKGIEEIKWLPVDKAMEQITFPHINVQIAQIINNPNQIWSGTLTQFKENENWKTKILQEFYVLSGE